MWVAAEALFGLWLGLGLVWLWRRGPASCLSALGGGTLAYAAAVALGWLGDLAFQRLGLNLWLRLASAGVVGTIAILLVMRWWRQRGETRRQRWAAALDGRMRGRLVLGGVLIAWVGGNLLAWLLLLNLLAAAIPALGASARSDSLISGQLLGSPSDADWRQELADQQAQWRGLAGGVDRILDATGARRVMELMDAVGWITGLDGDERARLVASSPELRRLASEPAMLAVIGDPRLMQQIDLAAQGSLAAAYALGAEPAVIALIESPAMRAAILAVDPVALRRHAAAGPRPDGPAWELGRLDSSLDLDALLAAPAGWTPQPAGGFLAWDADVRFGVARAALAAAAGPRRLHLTTEAPISCWFAGQLLRPEGRAPRREVTLPGQAGELIVLLDFAGLPPPHACACSIR